MSLFSSIALVIGANTAIFTLTPLLGIGATAAIFSLLALGLAPTPVR